jgi:NAD(P)H-flavin reductase
MIHEILKVQSVEKVAVTMFLLRLQSAAIAGTAKPGQFLNIRIDSGSLQPLLRRPFSISRIEGDSIELLISIAGKGTAKLSEKKSRRHHRCYRTFGKFFPHRKRAHNVFVGCRRRRYSAVPVPLKRIAEERKKSGGFCRIQKRVLCVYTSSVSRVDSD